MLNMGLNASSGNVVHLITIISLSAFDTSPSPRKTYSRRKRGSGDKDFSYWE